MHSGDELQDLNSSTLGCSITVELKYENGIISMRQALRLRILEVCDKKIMAKGESVGLSFDAFFKNKNDNPEELMEAAT